MPPVKLIDWSS